MGLIGSRVEARSALYWGGSYIGGVSWRVGRSGRITWGVRTYGRIGEGGRGGGKRSGCEGKGGTGAAAELIRSQVEGCSLRPGCPVDVPVYVLLQPRAYRGVAGQRCRVYPGVDRRAPTLQLQPIAQLSSVHRVVEPPLPRRAWDAIAYRGRVYKQRVAVDQGRHAVARQVVA